MSVAVPDGCLLVQAGKQMEWLTGGAILGAFLLDTFTFSIRCIYQLISPICQHHIAGYHEVVVTSKTLEAVELAKKEQRSCWRVSSTLFHHIASDQVLRPLGPYATPEALKKYPPIDCGAYVAKELALISLTGTAPSQ
jgi:hypothetical protein